MSPEQVQERRLLDLRRFTKLIQDQAPFAAVKFNDGELNAMIGHRGRNCDNHPYSPALKVAMLQAYSFLKPRAIISDFIVNFRRGVKRYNSLARSVGLPPDWFVHFAMLHDKPYDGIYDCRTPELKAFYQSIRDSDLPKTFIGPSRLRPELFLNLNDRINVPLINAFSAIEPVTKQALERAPNTLFLLCCGFSSCVLAHKILQVHPQATIVDLGSALDPILYGRTRKSQLMLFELREFYADFNNVRFPAMPHSHTEIPGWFNYGDLYSRMVNRFSHGHFVEVGCWMGKSAAYLATEIIKSGKPIKLDCVDHFKGSPGEKAHLLAKTQSIFGIAKNNLRPFWNTENNTDCTNRVDNVLRIIPLDSLTASKQYENESLDFVFIDAGHQEREVANDIKAWWPKIKPGGFLAGHDYASKSFPGVQRAVVKAFGRRHRKTSKNSWIVQKP